MVSVRASSSTPRLAPRTRDELSEVGKECWDQVVASRGAHAVDPRTSSLAGPFNAWVSSPHVGSSMVALGAALRFGSVLDDRLTELVILATAARWQCDFEWWAHADLALRAGIPGEVLDAIRTGRTPTLDTRLERDVFDVAANLLATGFLSDELYERTRSGLGDEGMVDLVALCGYYSTVAFTLNAFGVLPPGGHGPDWSSGRGSQ